MFGTKTFRTKATIFLAGSLLSAGLFVTGCGQSVALAESDPSLFQKEAQEPESDRNENDQLDSSDQDSNLDSEKPVSNKAKPTTPILFSAALTTTDPQFDGGEYRDRFTFSVEKPSHVTVEMRGNFGTYLMMAGPDGFLVETNEPQEVNQSLLSLIHI